MNNKVQKSTCANTDTVQEITMSSMSPFMNTVYTIYPLIPKLYRRSYAAVGEMIKTLLHCLFH